MGQKYHREGIQSIQIAEGGSEIVGFVIFFSPYFGHVYKVESDEGEEQNPSL